MHLHGLCKLTLTKMCGCAHTYTDIHCHAPLISLYLHVDKHVYRVLTLLIAVVLSGWFWCEGRSW